MAQYGTRGVMYSPRQSNIVRPTDGYNSPSYGSYRDASNMSRMYSPADQYMQHRDGRQHAVRSHEAGYGSQEFSSRSPGITARKELPFRKPSDYEPEFIATGSQRVSGVDPLSDFEEFKNDRIHNTLLDEICSDYGIKDSIELDFFNLDNVYPKITQLPDQGVIDQMIPFGALEADAELKNSKEGYRDRESEHSGRAGSVIGGSGKISHDEQIMPPPNSHGAMRRGNMKTPGGIMMARGGNNVYQSQAIWPANANVGYMSGKQGNSMGGTGMTGSGGNWGNDIIEAVASPTISSSCEGEQKPTPPVSDTTSSGAGNCGTGITTVHSTTNCSSTPSSANSLATGEIPASNVTDEDKSTINKILESLEAEDRDDAKFYEKVEKNTEKSAGDTKKADNANQKFMQLNDDYKDTSGNAVFNPPATTAALVTQMSSAATSASTSPSQLHATKKQRINTGSDLLEEVRDCFAFVHGADMFSVPNQHASFGDPMFPSSNVNSGVSSVCGSNSSTTHGYYTGSTGQFQSQVPPSNCASKDGVYSGTAQGYAESYQQCGSSSQRPRDYAHTGAQYPHNMQQQAVSAPCTPLKQRSGEGRGIWSSQVGTPNSQIGTPNSNMSQSRSLADTRMYMSAAAAEYGDTERQMYGSHPALNRAGYHQMQSQHSGSQTGSKVNAESADNLPNAGVYRGVKQEPHQTITKVQAASDGQRAGSPYRLQQIGDKSDQGINQPRSLYPQQNYQPSRHQNQAENASYQNQFYYNQQRQQAMTSDQYNLSQYPYQQQQLPASYQQTYQQQLLPVSYQQTYQQQQSYHSYQQHMKTPDVPGGSHHLNQDMAAQSSHIPLSQHGFLRRLINGDPSSRVYREHALFPLLRDLIIADMNFHTPTFPFRLIANLPTEFSKLIYNYQARNSGLVLEHPDHTVHGVVMDAVKYAHAALIGKIQSRKAGEGYIDRPRENIDDVCDSFEKSVRRTNMAGYQQPGDDFSRTCSPSIKHLPPHNTYDPTSPSLCLSSPPSISRSPSLPSLPYSTAAPAGEPGYMTPGGGGVHGGYLGEGPADCMLPPYPRTGSCGMMPSDAVSMAHRAVGYDIMPPSSPLSMTYGMNSHSLAGSPHMYYMGGVGERMLRGGVHSLPSSPRKLQYRSMADMGLGPGGSMIGGEKAGKNKVLPKEAVNVMIDWLREHQENPYPNDDEKESLIETTKLTINQINYWFTNARRRILPKWALQRHLAEQEKSRQKSSSSGAGSEGGASGKSSEKSRDGQSIGKEFTFIPSPEDDDGTYEQKPHIKSECREGYGRVECDTTA